MEKENEAFGNIFGTIELLSEGHLDMMLESMDKEHSTYYLIEGIKSAYQRGAFTLGEVEVLSKAIRVLSRTE
jgi:hypothetical protein